MVKDPAVRASNSLSIMFPVAWLEERAEGDPQGRTNKEVETEVSFCVCFSFADDSEPHGSRVS